MTQYFVYLISSQNDKAVYTGFTNNLERRLYEHRNELISGFSKKYKCKKLVHYEVFDDPENGIMREKQIKGWIRQKKNGLIEQNNPEWKDLSKQWEQDPSTAGFQSSAQDDIENKNHPNQEKKDSHPDRHRTVSGGVEGSKFLNRYTRHLALPEISFQQQKRLSETRILVIGAGGLGAAALPYLAGAGIGHITIMDHDTVSRSNLHRQTIYQDAQAGESKAQLAAAYARGLNPEIEVEAIPSRLCHSDRAERVEESEGSIRSLDYAQDDIFADADLILDGSDNFETKTLLNDIAIETKTPLLTASVNQFAGQVAVLGGHLKDAPCYHCLFPQLPGDARNCNEAGVLGTAAGLTGLYQAHFVLCFLLGIGDIDYGSVLSCDFRTMRTQLLHLPKDPACKACQNATEEREEMLDEQPIEIIPPSALGNESIIVDVRTEAEIAEDPIPGALHMELSEIPQRYSELPQDKRLAFACAANVRSAQAAAFVQAMGYSNVCIYDKLAE